MNDEQILALKTVILCTMVIWFLNFLAIVKPPARQLDESNLERAPVLRSTVYAGIGLVAAIWALASLVSG